MKIRVIVPFRDKAFNDSIIREEGTIIDTDLPEERCSVELAKERIEGGFCVEVKEMKIETPQEAFSLEKKGITVKKQEIPTKKGKKVNKKK